MKQRMACLLIGILMGAVLLGGNVSQAAEAFLKAFPSTHTFYLDGQPIEMEAYSINGNNYVKLRDIGRMVGFNVYWDNGVQVDTGAPYTGVAPTRDEQSVPASDISSMRQEIVDRTNQLRQEAGLADLETDVMLTQAAQVRADEMAATGTYSHIRPDGSDRSTVSNCPYTAENIHRIADRRLAELGKGLAEVVVDDWAASSGHLKNILNDGLSEIGVGLARGMNAAGEDCWYCVQIFAYEGYHVTWVDNPVE